MKIGHAALCLIAWACMSDPGMSQQPEIGTRIEFDSAATGKSERIWGHLSIPATSQARYPLMLIMHSSGGIRPRDWFIARTLNDMSVAAFVLDSFGPRSLTKVSENKRSFGEREQAIDALSALEILGKDARLDLTAVRFDFCGRGAWHGFSWVSSDSQRSRHQREATPCFTRIAYFTAY